MHRFPDQFLIVRENATKPILWRKPGKLVLIHCLLYGCFLRIEFLTYRVLHLWEIHGFSHQFPIVWENATKPIVQGEIGTHTFPHEIPMLQYTSSHWKCIAFLINFPQRRKRHENPSNGKSLGNWLPGKSYKNSSYVEKLRKWYLYFSHNTGAFFPLYFYLMVYLITQKMHGFSHQFSKVSEKTANPIEYGKSGKLVSKHFQLNRCFFYQIPILWYTLSYGKCMSFLIIFHSLGKVRKTHRMGKAWKISPRENPQDPSHLKNLGNWYSYFSHSMGAFFQLDSHPMAYFIICEMHGQQYIRTTWRSSHPKSKKNKNLPKKIRYICGNETFQLKYLKKAYIF